MIDKLNVNKECKECIYSSYGAPYVFCSFSMCNNNKTWNERVEDFVNFMKEVIYENKRNN